MLSLLPRSQVGLKADGSQMLFPHLKTRRAKQDDSLLPSTYASPALMRRSGNWFQVGMLTVITR